MATNLLDCPDEVLLAILKYLDSFSLINLSKASTRFERFYTDKQITNRVIFKRNNSGNLGWCNINNFLRRTSFLITHLDLSYIHWLPSTQLIASILKLKLLKHLNVVETGLSMGQVKNIIIKNQSINSLATSARTDYVDVDIAKDSCTHKLENLHFAFKTRENLEAIFGVINTFVSPKDIKTIDIKVAITIFQTDYNLAHRTAVVNLNSISKYNFDTVKLGNSEPHNMYNLCIIPGNDQLILEYHIFLETLDGIYLSTSLCEDIEPSVSHPFLRVIRLDFLFTNLFEHFFTIRLCKMNNVIETQNLMDYIYKRINERKTEGLLLYADKYCPMRGFNVTSLKGLRQLCFQPCLLSVAAAGLVGEPKVADPPLFKKKRVSRIPHLPDVDKQDDTGLPGVLSVLEDVAKSNEGLEYLKICQMSHKCQILSNRCMDWILDTSSLHSITNFKNLKHLSLSLFPNSPSLFFIQIFEACHVLESVTVHSLELQSNYVAEALTENLQLCKTIKYLRFVKCQFRDLNALLIPLINCPTLEVIDISHHNYKAEASILASLLDIVYHCRHLTHLLIERNGLTQKMISEYKRYEAILQEKNRKLYVNLVHRTCNIHLIKCINEIDHFYM